ncbi:hypothetical protein H4219_005279 [Mycoemilia scoparia]|uniref:Uncharacterized protein n=1 Tax=Mycoemilia scoparia TaxID=417184 RepID=A0A9W8DPU7_9FUNG|nr:hypothetical protein H4219_005279 [Mycoemilia scoparia]
MVKITTDSESKFEPVQGNQDKDAVPTKVVEQQQPQQEQPQDDVDELTNKMNNLELPEVPKSGLVELNTWLPDYIAAMETTEATAEEKAVKALEILWDAKLFIQTNPSKTPGFYYPIKSEQLYKLLTNMYTMSILDMASLLRECNGWTSTAFPMNVLKPTLFKYFVSRMTTGLGIKEASRAIYKFVEPLGRIEFEPYTDRLFDIYVKGNSNAEACKENYKNTITKICECYATHYYWRCRLMFEVPFILDDSGLDQADGVPTNVVPYKSNGSSGKDNSANTKEFFVKLGYQSVNNVSAELVDINGSINQQVNIPNSDGK